ncbi:protein adenylyltransferase SelO [Thiofilum flexile]|uniref:protein adenylyltransferase SelO n=1 Tax=Thiofilum flexile TaxID=125627 RepID=UPI0003659E47|nr:YdiU family protein [Thiofilum flexile]
MHPLQFDNRFVQELPGDPITTLNSRQVVGALWSKAPPTPVQAPRLLSYSPEVAELLGWTAEDMHSSEAAQILSGNQLLEGMFPVATCYGGHQFGNWAGQLGDGRAISLGESINAKGERWELQLKGAGKTPYSRHADGRAVLRSSVREYLCSEAMYHLGIPTTRALSLVATGDGVLRDMFYDGHPKTEPGAIVCRVAPSFIRFGHFELPAARGDVALLNQLIDFTIERDYPQLIGHTETKRAQWFELICLRTARLMADWMRVGFVHGVMNTDNMSILGLTIDYGPYGWLEDYNPLWTPNTTDAQGLRYSYAQQPYIAHWNLAQLANALATVMPDEPLEAGLRTYALTYNQVFNQALAAKLGLKQLGAEDESWVEQLFELLRTSEVDMTLFFRELAQLDLQQPNLSVISSAFYRPEYVERDRDIWDAWLALYAQRSLQELVNMTERKERMNAVNPRFVLRNYLAQEAIDLAEQGDNSRIDQLLQVLRKPYAEQPEFNQFAQKRPEWARVRAGCSMLSCSS